MSFLSNNVTLYDLISYVYHYHDLSAYVLFRESGDPNSYIQRINSKYQNSNQELSLNTLKREALFNLIDPLLVLSAYQILFKYLPNGIIISKIPMIDLGAVDFIPLYRFALTPFGYERYLDFCFRYQSSLLNFYGRLGDDAFNTFWGFGFEGINLIQFRTMKFSVKFDFWRQPSLASEFSSSNETYNYGVNCNIETKFTIASILPDQIRILLLMGYKTNGYLIGMELKNSFYLRSGFTLRI